MLKTIKSALFLGTALLLIAIPSRVAAQNFDSSGTSNLSGPYLFRYVNFFNDASGNLVESCSLTGVMTFDGAGNYTVANATLYDSAGAGGSGYCTNLGGGTYGVQPNGLAQLDNPLYAATLFGTFSKPVVIASSTEDYYFDLFVALPAPQGSVSNSSFSGTFTAGALDFLNASNSLAREGYFNLHADGNGNITPFSVTGSTASSASNIITQNVGASTYSLSGTSGGTLTFPGSATDPTQIISGSRVLYVSADSNYFLAGSTSGSDIIFGFRAVSGSASNSLLSGTYFLAGLDDNLYSGFLDAFYGSINSSGDGNLIWHERFDDAVDYVTYDSSFYTPVSIGSDGTYYDGTYSYLTGANGNAMMLIGSGAQFSLNIGIKSPAVTPTSTVWLNPVGITNAANYTPITNAFAPGELVILYGNFGVPLDVDTVLPIPTNLDNVQVLVNGRAAPVYYVSKNQISALVPYEVSGDYFATFQVSVNGSKSNTVTVYVDNSSPGIYTMTQNGLGAGALLHADYSLITDSSPAKPGETVLLFMNGLGTVTPAVADGAPGPAPDLAYSDGASTTSVYLVDGVNYPAQTIVQYAGLAPYYAGLYQVNFTLPTTGVANGDVYIAFNTLEGVNEMATIAVAGFPGSAAVGSSSLRPVRPRGNAIPRRTAGAKSHRRALPERIRK